MGREEGCLSPHHLSDAILNKIRKKTLCKSSEKHLKCDVRVSENTVVSVSLLRILLQKIQLSEAQMQTNECAMGIVI